MCVGEKTDQDSVTDHFESLRDTGLTWGYPAKESACTSGKVLGPKDRWADYLLILSSQYCYHHTYMN